MNDEVKFFAIRDSVFPVSEIRYIFYDDKRKELTVQLRMEPQGGKEQLVQAFKIRNLTDEELAEYREWQRAYCSLPLGQMQEGE